MDTQVSIVARSALFHLYLDRTIHPCLSGNPGPCYHNLETRILYSALCETAPEEGLEAESWSRMQHPVY